MSLPAALAEAAFATTEVLVEAAVCAVAEATGACGGCGEGACGEVLICGGLAGGVVAAAGVLSSRAANGEASESCAEGVGGCHWDEGTGKVALTSDAELGTIDPYDRKDPMCCLQRTGQRDAQTK